MTFREASGYHHKLQKQGCRQGVDSEIFVNSVNGVVAIAVLYSLVQTATSSPESMRRSQKNKIVCSVTQSLLLLVTMVFWESLPALGLTGSNSLPAHSLYANKLAKPEQPDPFPFGFMLLSFSLLQLLPNISPHESLQLPLLPDWPIKQTRRIDRVTWSPEAPEKTTNTPIAMGAAGGDDGDKPPDGNNWNSDPEPQPDLILVPDPVQKCQQQKRQLLRVLRIKRLWATMTGQTTLARIMSDRIMVIKADLLDLERSGPAGFQTGLVQSWLAENGQELSVYCEIISGKYSGRQAASGDKNQTSRTTKEPTTAATAQNSQRSRGAAPNQRIASIDGSDRGGDEPPGPSAQQDTGKAAVNCSKCDKALTQQELRRVANETAASAFLCNQCLSDTHSKKRARPAHHETEPDSSEPAQKKKKDVGRKRNISIAAAAPPAKKSKPADTQPPDDPLEKVKENIKYKLSKEDLEKVQTLLEVFKKKNITVKHTFYKLLGFVERESFNGFFDNATAFFGQLPENVKNTGMLTSMLHNVRKYIRSFAQTSQDELEYLAGLDLLTSLSSMNNSKGIPRQEEVEEVLGWPEWKDQNGEFDRERFQSFSSMYNTKGLPEHKDVEEVLGWSEWKDKDGQFNIKLFRCFSSMNHAKGKLKYGKVKEILGWPEWKDKYGKFNMELFRAFSSLNSSKGMLKHEAVEEILDWPEWKDKYGKFNMELFRAFSSLNSSKGMLKHEAVEEILDWPVWKDKDGEFNMELFRAFSSMNSCKGMLKKKEVEEVLAWPEWKDRDDEFNMELFRAFSSMNNGKGVPKNEEHKKLKAMLGWPEWRDKNGQFNMELFRSFSSMFAKRGIPKHKEVKVVLGWQLWKDKDGQFNMELFRAFSSLNGSKGMPLHEEVKEILSWPVWKDKDGEFNIELLRAFSSMNCGRGMLKKKEVEEVLAWPEWKDRDGKFNMELFRAFSSIHNNKGVPKHEEHKKLKAMLNWPEWRDEDSQFNMDLFRSFSSMFAKRGMPKHKEVKAVLGWQVWKDKDGEFSMELFRTFASLNHARGLPEHEEEVKELLGWQVWKDEYGEFSMERFRTFTAMNSGKGPPRYEDVKEMLNWPEWKEKDGKFVMERLRAFSSMNFSRGMPRYEQVKRVLGWPEWKDQDGEFSKERFRAFSSINYGQGVPKHGPVKKVMNWISCGGAPNHLLLQIMARLWASEGLPATEELKHQEAQLKQWLLTESTEENSGLDDNLDNEENDKFNRQLKTVSLYLSTPKPDWLINWAVLKQFHHREKTKPALMLKSLIRLLSSYGGKGVRNYLKANQRNRNFLWRHSGKTTPLHVLKKTMALFSSDEYRERYVYFVKRLMSLPGKNQWQQLSTRLQQLSGVLKHDSMKRLYWEILQPLTKDDQLRFLDASHARAVFDLFPSLSALQKLSKEHSSQYLKRLLEACLQLKTHEITKKGIQILFEALLKTHSLLPWDQDIPDHFLSGMRSTDNNNVEITVSGHIQSGKQLALSYIAVLLQNLNEMSFTVKGQRLEVEVDGVQTYRFPMPLLKIRDEKIEISNWTEEQLRIFLKITEMSERYYLTADEWQKRLKPDCPVYIQRRKAKLAANRELRAEGALTAAPFNPIPVHVLILLVRRGMTIKPITWRSLDHHKERLPAPLFCQLREKVEASGSECPDEIKESLSQYLDNIQPGDAEACDTVSETEAQSINLPDSKREKQAFDSLWSKLNQTEIFGTEILNLLDEYGDEMELTHTVTVLKKAKIDIADHILEGWRQRACSKIEQLKKRDTLLSDVAPDVYQNCQELELLDEH